VKTFYREEGHIRLQPENRELEPIIVKDPAILGRVVASMRYQKNRRAVPRPARAAVTIRFII
jgi:hypothetical protein